MTVYVALLRGINIGNRRIKMDALRVIAEGCGFGAVQTYVQSGNLVFTSRKSVATVGRELHDRILDQSALDARVVVRTAAQMQEVVEANPWPERVGDPTKVSVSYLFDPVAPTLNAVDPADYAPDEVAVVGAHAYLFTPNGMGRSKLVEPLVKRMGIPGTVRNWRTTVALRDLATATG